MTVEPSLQPLSGESLHPRTAITSDNARLDVRADGFWDCPRQSAFFDVRIFNPTAQSCRNQSLPACYRRHELEKRRHYEDRVIQIEHGCFTPLVFSTSGGMGPSASIFFKRLASLLSTKRNAHYGSVMSWIRCKMPLSTQQSCVSVVPALILSLCHLTSIMHSQSAASPQLPNCRNYHLYYHFVF